MKFPQYASRFRQMTATITAVFVMVICLASAAFAADTVNLTVKLVNGLSSAEQAAVIAHNGGVEKSTIAPLRIHVVTVPTTGLPLILQDYQNDPKVESVEVIKSRKAEGLSNDQHVGVQWSLAKIGWDAVYGKVVPKGTAKVALLDTGIDAGHPDLKGNVLTGTSILDGSTGLTDPSGHGTQMAGIVVAVTGNNRGIAGIAYKSVKIMPVTVLDAAGVGQDNDIIAGVVWAADHGADVILMGFSNPDFSQHLQDAIDYAWSKGAVLVAATGNGGVATPTFPAGDRGVVGVSATDQSDVLASFSNTGLDVFLAAPGSAIYTTDLKNSYTYISGTSPSSAIVAGVAAFMKAVDPTLTNGVILGRLARGADAANNPQDPGFTGKYGYGRVNMANALADTGSAVLEPVGAATAAGGAVGPYKAAAVSGSCTAGTAGSDVLITCTGSGTFTPSANLTNVQILVVGGGGGGGGTDNSGTRYGGGGGAGGYRYGSTYSLSNGTAYNVTVGSGGGGGSNTARGINGASSSVIGGAITITAAGGGGGGTGGPNTTAVYTGANGGSGGGGGRYTGGGAGPAGTGTSGQGNNGAASDGSNYGGGAGGAGAAGATKNGGTGTANSITGSSVTYACGGGGGSTAPAGTAGCSSAGAGVTAGNGNNAPTANRGSGGGGGAGSNTARSGGTGSSGVVFIRYAAALTPDTPSVSNSPQTYTGSAKTITVSCLSGGTATSITPTSRTTVGSSPVTASCPGNANYSATTAASAGSFVINQAVDTPSVSNSPQTYTGSALNIAVSCASGGTAASINPASHTNAGSTPVTASCPGNANYSATTAASAGSFVINQTVDTPSVSNSPQTYTGSALNIAVSCASGGTAASINPASYTNAGSTPVTASCPGDTNHSATTNVSAGNFVISPATPTASITTTPVIYNGSAQTAVVSCLGGGAATLASGGTGTNAGSYPATVNCLASSNYAAASGLTPTNNPFVISKATPTQLVNNSPVTYNNSAKAATISGSVPGIASNIKYSGSLTQPVGANTYSVTANFTPTDTTNYNSLTDVTAGDFIISKATPTLSVTNSPATWTGLPLAALVSGSVPGLVSTISTGGASTQTDVGTYAVTANFVPTDITNYISLNNAPAGNFVISAPTAVTVTVQSVPAGRSITVDGNVYTTPHTFTDWAANSSHLVTMTSPQDGSTGTQYVFNNWADGGTMNRSITAPSGGGSATYTANFSTQYRLTIAAGTGASVLPAVGSYWYAAGSNASISASALSGYAFSSWSGPVANFASAATSVTMNGPATVTANMQGISTTLKATVSPKTGTVGGLRSWTINVSNTGGSTATAAQLTYVKFSANTAGTCRPTVDPATLPKDLGDIDLASPKSAIVIVDFTGCAKLDKFNVSIGYSANNGGTTGVTSLTGQAQ